MSDWDAAKARYTEKRAERERLETERRSLETALSLARNSQDADTDRCSAARQIAGEYRRLAERRPEIVEAKLRQVTYELEDGAAEFQRETDVFNAAMRTESNRVARELQPTHREAVAGIISAVEALSRAVAAEREVRAEFYKRSPEPESALLPIVDGPFGALGEFNSLLSGYVRHVRRLGFLD
jgi:hypothetical protein